MSHSYSMSVTIAKSHPWRRQHIIDAACDEWDFEDWEVDLNTTLTAIGDGSLSGDDVAQFTDRLASAIMRANQGPCHVIVAATCLENPHPTHERGAVDYERYAASWPPVNDEESA